MRDARATPYRRHRVARPSTRTAGIAVVVVLALVCAGLIVAVVQKSRNEAAIAARAAASYTPPVSTTGARGGAQQTVAVISDDSAVRAASGVPTSERWPRLLGPALGAAVSTSASVGSGYLNEGANGRTFEEAAADVPTDADVVLFVGGAADVDSTSIAVASAATRAFAAAKARAPGAAIVAVGPLFVPSIATDAQMSTLRSALSSSARIAEVAWVDPVRSSWLEDVGAAGDLDAEAERTIADRLRSVVDSAPTPG